MKELLKKQKVAILMMLLIAVLATTLIWAGGFFDYVSCFMLVIMAGIILIVVISNNSFVYKLDINVLIVGYIVICYATSCLWAVDKGMSTVGFYKLLPALLFLLLAKGLKEKKESIIRLLPLFGVIITVITYVMSRLASFKDDVLVAGRLSGSFQYPNTYAAFLLVCLVILAWEREWMSILYAVVLLFGIYQTGSRTVMALTVVMLVVVLFTNKAIRKYVVIALLLCIVTILALAVLGKVDIEKNLSTMYGRFLYWKDSLKIIINHPFGMGYYGYYFVQSEYQTGVYSVLNAHNEYLQMAMDVGIVPAVAFVTMLFHALFDKNITVRNRCAIFVMMAHAFADYDFQFVGMWFVLILLLEKWEVKKLTKTPDKQAPNQPVKYSAVTKVFVTCILGGIMYGAIIKGLSMYNYSKGNYEKSYQYGKFNTMALIYQMYDEDDFDRLRLLTERVIEKNKHAAIAYRFQASSDYSDGELIRFVENEEKALKMSPYDYSLYNEYIDALYRAAVYFNEDEDLESIAYCYEHAVKTGHFLETVKNKTSSLAWKIDDKPMVELSEEQLHMITEIKHMLEN